MHEFHGLAYVALTLSMTGLSGHAQAHAIEEPPVEESASEEGVEGDSSEEDLDDLLGEDESDQDDAPPPPASAPSVSEVSVTEDIREVPQPRDTGSSTATNRPQMRAGTSFGLGGYAGGGPDLITEASLGVVLQQAHRISATFNFQPGYLGFTSASSAVAVGARYCIDFRKKALSYGPCVGLEAIRLGYEIVAEDNTVESGADWVLGVPFSGQLAYGLLRESREAPDEKFGEKFHRDGNYDEWKLSIFARASLAPILGSGNGSELGDGGLEVTVNGAQADGLGYRLVVGLAGRFP